MIGDFKLSEERYWSEWNGSWIKFKFGGKDNGWKPILQDSIRPTLIISDVILRSLRVVSSVGRRESSPKETKKAFLICRFWTPLTHGVPTRHGITAKDAFRTQHHFPLVLRQNSTT